MNIQYCSDLHLEFPENRQYLQDHPIKPTSEVLLLAGDIVPFASIYQHADFFDFVADHFETTYWVPGNHEYYHSDLADRCGTIQERIRNNVWLVNNVTISHLDVRLVFSTLWTQISPINLRSIQQGMADFHVIHFNGQLLNPHSYNEQHRLCLDFLTTELRRKTEKTIVVTHHVPTFKNYPDQYKGSVLNEAFAVELDDLINSSGVNYWIYGHHHRATPAFQIGSTSLVTNQLGYVGHNEHGEFSHRASVEL